MAVRHRMIRSGRWKLVDYNGNRPQLFDIEEDPRELRAGRDPWTSAAGSRSRDGTGSATSRPPERDEAAGEAFGKRPRRVNGVAIIQEFFQVEGVRAVLGKPRRLARVDARAREASGGRAWVKRHGHLSDAERDAIDPIVARGNPA